MLNSVILMGRATKDPIVRKSSNDMTIANFDIAVDNLRKEADGSRGTTFLPVTCFGNIADNVAKYVRKGSKIAVVGSIQQRSYLAPDGSKRTAYDIIADSVEFLDPKPAEEPSVEELEADVPVESAEAEKPKFDPYTGKPLNTKSKK